MVRRLRAQVDRATSALHRLQAENQRLRRRVEELEEHPALHPDATTFVLDDEPNVLRERISSFLDAIDTVLEEPPPSDSSSSPHSSP